MKRSAVTRHAGVSKRTIVHTSQLGGRQSEVLTSGKQNKREAAAQQKRRAAIQSKKTFSSALRKLISSSRSE